MALLSCIYSVSTVMVKLPGYILAGYGYAWSLPSRSVRINVPPHNEACFNPDYHG